MRYSLLNFIACPATLTELACVVTKEAAWPFPHVRLTDCDRINQPGAMFGPAPHFDQRTWLTEFLEASACEPAPHSRNYEAAVEEGLLISGDTGRWYPIRNFIPELLPDHLRDFVRDFEFLESLRPILPPALFDRLHDPAIFGERVQTGGGIGEQHKRAEMTISSKVDDPSFFGPGYVAPFNPSDPEHTVYLIRLFSFCLSLLRRNSPNKVVLDPGCGYSWTTEWLLKIGFEPIGVDITRTYLDIAASRLGAWSPHLVLADTENLPVRTSAADAVLCYEAFHHVADRKKAMRQFFRVLKPGKTVILAEPGPDHEYAPGPIEVMQKYGILERGMSCADLRDYIRGSGFLDPVQHHFLEIDDSLAGQAAMTNDLIARHGFTATNLYTIDKPAQSATERVKSAMRRMRLLPT